MRVALCQIDPTVGDLDANTVRILEAARGAHDRQAQLAVFPELSLCGYPPRDLLDRPGFVGANLETLDRLARGLPGDLPVLAGFVDRETSAARTSLFNAAALLLGGKVVRVFHKRLLPTYDVFDEARYFTCGRRPLEFDLPGIRLGVTICEDAWNDVDSPLRRHYDENPVAECVRQGVKVLINIAASPFTLSKREARADMLARVARNHGIPLVMVNQVGGNDDLVFDGASAIFGDDGSLWGRARSFDEEVMLCEIAADQPVAEAPGGDAAATLGALVLGTRDYARKCGFRRVVLGLSGGVDSSLVACIAARALGPENVLGVAMPTRYSSEGSRADAAALAEALGIEFCVIDIDDIFQCFLDTFSPAFERLGPGGPRDTTYENIQARIRGTTLMAISNRLGHLLLTTGNKSEIAVGYCTLYGDMAGGLAVISDLPKTFVYEVAREVNRQAGRDVIPHSTMTKPPSAELRPGQTDQDTLPPYDVLDAVLERLIEEGQGEEEIVRSGYDPDLVSQVAAMVRNNEYKRRQMPPGLIITRKAFGPGRRYPIAQHYRG